MTAALLDVQDLCKRYGTHWALRDLTFRVEPGGVVGFLGVNGAGKSTFMRIAAGFLSATSGTVRVNGIDVSTQPRRAKQQIAYLPESNPLYPELRVREFLHYRARLRGVPRHRRRAAVDGAVERCLLGDVSERIIGHLSKGYRQRVGLAECLLAEVPLLILDEPTVGLDPNQLRAIRELVVDMARERTVFLSTHILQEAESLCRQVVIIHGGCLLAIDTPHALCGRARQPRILRVDTTAPRQAVAALDAVPGVAGVECENTDGGTRCRLTCAGAPDEVRGAVLRCFAREGWVLREMQIEPVRLEDIFAEITGAREALGQGAAGGGT